MLTLTKDISQLLSEKLYIEDIQKLYNAGGDCRRFVNKYYLKNGRLVHFVLEGTSLAKYIDILKYTDQYNKWIHLDFSNAGITIYSCVDKCNDRYIIKLKKSFFKEYFCVLPLKYACYGSDLIQMSNNMQAVIHINYLTKMFFKSEACWRHISSCNIEKAFKNVNKEIAKGFDINLTHEELVYLVNIVGRSLSDFKISKNILKISTSSNTISKHVNYPHDFEERFLLSSTFLLPYKVKDVVLSFSDRNLVIKSEEDHYELFFCYLAYTLHSRNI